MDILLCVSISVDRLLCLGVSVNRCFVLVLVWIVALASSSFSSLSKGFVQTFYLYFQKVYGNERQ